MNMSKSVLGWIKCSHLHVLNTQQKTDPFFRKTEPVLDILDKDVRLYLYLVVNHKALEVLARFTSKDGYYNEKLWSIDETINYVASHPHLGHIFPRFVNQIFKSPPPPLKELAKSLKSEICHFVSD